MLLAESENDALTLAAITLVIVLLWFLWRQRHVM